MSVDWNRIAKEHWDAQPSPHNPQLTNAEYPVAVKLATLTKFGQGDGHASAAEAGLFWMEFKQTGLSPKQYEEALHRMAPVSYALHGRPPSMDEIVRLKDEHPEAVNKYYHHLPDQHYPSVPAGEMVRHLAAAEIPALQVLGRKPNKLEASMLYHSRENPVNFYERLKPKADSPTDGTEARAGTDTGGRGVAAIGRSSPDERGGNSGGQGLREG